MVLPLTIPCGHGAIRVYSRPIRGDCDGAKLRYRAHFTVGKGQRERAGLMEGIPKGVLNQNEKDVAWSETEKLSEQVEQAMSHTAPMDRSPLVVAIFQTHPFEGIARILQRKFDDKVRVQLSRPGYQHVYSKWQAAPFEAFESIRDKCIDMGREVPLITHNEARPGVAGVKIIHQTFGLYRDGKGMSELFLASSSAWQAYAKRHQCEYILWTADKIDLFMQLEAPDSVPDWVLELYTDVRFALQRVHVARFVILFVHGGLYANLDVFPQLEMFPEVSLGLCKVLAKPTRTMRAKHEWATKLLVAIKGNPFLLDILQAMFKSMAEKSQMKCYDNRPCIFIDQTTGPKLVGRTVQEQDYESRITVFAMCRPARGLEKHISVVGTGRVSCHRLGLRQYDVLSALSMSYNAGGKPCAPSPLARLPAQRPPYPQNKKRPRWSFKTTEAPADELLPGTEANDAIAEEMQPGYEPQQSALQAERPKPTRKYNANEEGEKACDDMVDLFLTGSDNGSVNVCYSLLRPNTCKYLRSLQQQRA